MHTQTINLIINQLATEFKHYKAITTLLPPSPPATLVDKITAKIARLREAIADIDEETREEAIRVVELVGF